MCYQKTIQNTVSLSGIGLHTGQKVTVTLKPALPNWGIEFKRTDLSGSPGIKAHSKNVIGTAFATTLGGRGFSISTVEHLMAALFGMGIDNAIVEVDGDEIPIMDGSADPFAYLISSVGLQVQDVQRDYIRIIKPIEVAEGDRKAALLPSDGSGFEIDYRIDFDHPMIRIQQLALTINDQIFETQVASARTFGFLSDINMLKANGFAAGGSLENAVVIGNYSILNKGGLRYPDEFVRHKILDAIGDFALAGYRIKGTLVANKSGHGLNSKLVKRLLDEKRCWHLEVAGDWEEVPFTSAALQAVG